MGETMENELQPGSGYKASGNPARDINLKALALTVKKRIWLLILSTLVLGALGGWYSSIPSVPVYGASARIILGAGTPELLATLKTLVREPIVLERALENLGADIPVEELRSRISVQSVDNSVITTITAVANDPRAAADLSNAVVAAFVEESNRLLQYRGASILTQASSMDNPYPLNPPSNRALLAGIVAGVLMGLGLIFLIESLDDSLRSGRDLEKALGVKCLGQVPPVQKKDWFSKGKRKIEYIRGETIDS